MTSWFIQLVESARDEAEARRMLATLRTMDGYKGGRVLSPSDSKPSWRVQAFFEDAPDATWLPDGLRRVYVPATTRSMLGILP